MEKIILLVAEGETDIIVFKAIAKHLGNEKMTFNFLPLAPQKDATSGSYPAHGFGEVLNWCRGNQNKIQMLIDFKGASTLFVQMDTDIATQINETCIQEQKNPRQCCEESLHKAFSSLTEPERCYYILPTENTETWLLASHNNLDSILSKITDYEQITNTEQHLIAIGYASRKKVGNKRKLDKKKAEKRYTKYAQQLVDNLPLARQRCKELDRLCNLIINA